MRAFRAVKRCAIPAGGILGCAWATDEYYCHQVSQRTLRTLKTGGLLLWEYKVRWTPETSHEVHARVAKQLVACMKKNEGLYVKFGQAMATMDVILPEEYKRELATLADQAATFDFADVREVVESDLGCCIEDVFSEFDEHPIASASIAQVHRAKLRCSQNEHMHADRCVAVKVQKPNIPAQNGCDLLVYRFILHVLEYAFELPLAWTFDYTKRQLDAELDFRIEAQNARRASKELEDCKHLRGKVVVPKVYTELSGRHVMVMEWIDSIGAVSDGTALRHAGLKAPEVMRTATQVFGHQIFSTGHVHCDPHPGNLLVRFAPSGSSSSLKWQLVLLDHGLYCEMSPQLRKEYADFWVAATLGDGPSCSKICRSWGIADEGATELFASLTQFRRVRLGEGRLGTVVNLFNKNTARQTGSTSHDSRKKLTAAERAKAEQELKERAKKILADTKAFPQELFFVGRSLNIIRSANFSLGSVVNRVAILAECAAAGSALGGPLTDWKGDGLRSSVLQQAALFRFHARVQALVWADRILRTIRSAREMMRLHEPLSSFCAGLAPILLGISLKLLRRGSKSSRLEELEANFQCTDALAGG